MVLALMPQMVFADEGISHEGWVKLTKDILETNYKVEAVGSYTYDLPSGNYYLGENILVDKYINITEIEDAKANVNVTLDLNGYELKRNTDIGMLFNIVNHFTGYTATLTLMDSSSDKTGKIICSSDSGIDLGIDGKLNANGGTVECGIEMNPNGAVIYNTDPLNITVFAGKVTNWGTISSGIYHGEVVNNGTISGGIFNKKVINYMNIENGTFKGYVQNELYILDGTFYGTVDNGDHIKGGTFYGPVNNKSSGHIYGGVFYGGIDNKDGGDVGGSNWPIVTFKDGDSTYATEIVKNGEKAIEPTAPTKYGYKFTGWYTDETLTIPYNFGSEVAEDIPLYAGWDEIITLTVPFTTTVVKKGGSLEPPKDITFNLEVVSPSGDKISSDDVEITAESVTTNGAKSYDGTLKIKGTSEDIAKMLRGKVFVKQAEGNYPNWDVDDAVWGLVWQDEVVALASADSAAMDNSVFIFPAEYVETENGGYYEMVEGKDTVDKMTFTNTYTKSEAGTVDPEGTTGGDSDNDNDSKAGAEDSAKTGDDANLALWLALMLLSGAGITGAAVYTRRKRTNE